MSGESAILTQFEFQFDPTKIPVDEIVEEWRAQSTKGCYESAMWRAAGLEEPAAGSHSKRGPRLVSRLKTEKTVSRKTVSRLANFRGNFRKPKISGLANFRKNFRKL
jgi:hypothetical protein